MIILTVGGTRDWNDSIKIYIKFGIFYSKDKNTAAISHNKSTHKLMNV